MKFYPEDESMLGWAAYYFDPETNSFKKYTSKDILWENLPISGVQVVVKRFKNPDGTIRTERITGHEVYLENWAAEEAIKDGQSVSRLVKFGTMLSDELFHPLYDAVLEDIERGYN